MPKVIVAVLLALLLTTGSVAAFAQSEPKGLPAVQKPSKNSGTDPQATYRLLSTVAGAVAASTVVALLVDGWIVELMMAGGVSAAEAGVIVNELEGEGGAEAGMVALSAIVGGIGGARLGRWLFPPETKPDHPVPTSP